MPPEVGTVFTRPTRLDFGLLIAVTFASRSRGLTLREWHEDHAEVDLEADSPVEEEGFEPLVPPAN